MSWCRTRPASASSGTRRRSSAIEHLMFTRHFAHWPPGQPRTLELPQGERLREPGGERGAASAARGDRLLRQPPELCRAQAAGRCARRLSPAALGVAARRPRASLRAEQPAVRHRLLRDPARRRGGRAGQPDEPHRRAAPLRRGLRRARGDRRQRRAARARAARPGARAADRVLRLSDRDPPTFRCPISCAPPGSRGLEEALARKPRARRRTSPGPRTLRSCPTPRARPASPRAACTRTPACRRPRCPTSIGAARRSESVVLCAHADVPRHRHAGRHERADPYRAPRWWCCRAGTATAPRCRSSARGSPTGRRSPPCWSISSRTRN